MSFLEKLFGSKTNSTQKKQVSNNPNEIFRELAGLVAAAETWYQNNPGNAPSQCPQRDQIREIGQRLH